MVIRSLLASAIFLAAACGDSASSNSEPLAAPDQLGPFMVGHTEDVVIDASRGGRELPVDIWYPIDNPGGTELTLYALQGSLGITSEIAYRDATPSDGQRPLIVFSHGFGAINTQSIPLMEHLASHGYVVVSPEHTGNINGDLTSDDPAGDRVPDVKAVIDAMRVRSTSGGDPLYGRIDTENVGVAGHSFGGFTATALGTGFRDQAADPRVRAVMPIAPGNREISDADLARLTVPSLFLCGTLDSLFPEHERSFAHAGAAPNLFRVDVIDATHTHFANICQIGEWLIGLGLGKDVWPLLGASALIGPWEEACEPPALDINIALRVQNLYAAALFGRYLNGDARYGDYLTERYARENEPAVSFFESD